MNRFIAIPVVDGTRLVDGATGELAGVQADMTGRTRAEEVLRSAASKEAGRRRRKPFMELVLIILLSVFVFIVGDYTDCFLPAFRSIAEVNDAAPDTHLDEAAATLVFLSLAMLFFSYRRWQESRAEVVSQTSISRALRGLNEEMETRVRQRTAELDGLNEALRREVIERKTGEDSLKLFRMLIDRTSDGIEVIDPETGRFLDVNETICERLGYSREEMLTLNVMDVSSADLTGDRWRAAMEKLRLTHSNVVETEHRRKDGSRMPVEINISYSESNRSYVVAVVRDITERKKADQHLKLISSALKVTANAIVITDGKGVIEWANPAFTSLTGYSNEEAVGKNPRMLKSGRQDRAFYKNLWDTILAGHVWQGELINQRKDGTVYTEEMTITPIKGDGDQIEHFIAVKQDVTARKLLEAKFLRAQRMESVGTLAGGIAHDLNNVLGPILMIAEVLQDEVTDAQGRKMLQVLEASARHGADLVAQVLAFARGVEGKRIMLNPVHILHEIQNMIRDTFPKNIDFQFHPERDGWTVEGDPTQLHQVITNLCVNARDAMPNGGALKATIENAVLDEMYADMNSDAKPGNYVVITVEDTGTGIPADIREKIFEPFFTTKEIGKGTGLGLSTTVGIVRSHNGFIRVCSEMGRGTSFKVYLPANAPGNETEAVAARDTPLPRGNGELVLVVDDEERMRAVVQNTLERFGYRVMLANNGAEAVAIYAQNREQIAVVLTDMAMPVMDGPATMVALRALNSNLKIIGSSGLPSGGDYARAEGAAVRHFVPKPYTAETLLKALAETLHGVG